ncbi:MAG: chemotaxis protein CheW [Candidatus Cloacimonetes bacterium]|nr:chemotaxis protein CheW [Candidatus Cloacimonadota bacterium]
MVSENQKILKQRAESLAAAIPSAEQKGVCIPVLTFFLADEKYGLEAEYVDRVIALKRFTDIPCTPDYILGMINVQGEILAVLDIKKLFRLPDKGITNLNRVIVVGYEGIKFGILCDEVAGREEVPENEMQAKLPNIAGIKSALIRGVTKDRLIIINTLEFFKDKRIIIDEKV